MFGSELMAIPITAPADAQVGMSRSTIWFPPGEWFNFWDGTHYCGPEWHICYTALEDIPLYAKAGAIVPLQERRRWGGIANPQEIELLVFPGADGSFELYEDDGVTTDYQNGKFALTRIHHTIKRSYTITNDPVQETQPYSRYKVVRIKVRGITAPLVTTYVSIRKKSKQQEHTT
jgi:alpha-glucosidase (family GH31 glycosyl hydrolase)